MRKLTILFSIIILLYSAQNSETLPITKPSNLIITGHRGAAGLAPENTLASIREALRLGVERVEVDIRQTKDNVVIVMHDSNLRRTTNGSGQIQNKTFAELSQLSAGLHFAPAFREEKIPRLEEVIHLINGNAELIIEIKASGKAYPNIEQRVLEMLDEKGAKDWCIIQSFNDTILKKVHELDSTIRLHKLFVGKIPFLPLSIDFWPRWGGVETFDFVSEISLYHAFVNKAIVKKAHAKGVKVNAWTVNRIDLIEKLLDMEVDGIITDYPNLFEERNTLKK